jgi:hypothetical protein
VIEFYSTTGALVCIGCRISIRQSYFTSENKGGFLVIIIIAFSCLFFMVFLNLMID